MVVVVGSMEDLTPAFSLFSHTAGSHDPWECFATGHNAWQATDHPSASSSPQGGLRSCYGCRCFFWHAAGRFKTRSGGANSDGGGERSRHDGMLLQGFPRTSCRPLLPSSSFISPGCRCPLRRLSCLAFFCFCRFYIVGYNHGYGLQSAAKLMQRQSGAAKLDGIETTMGRSVIDGGSDGAGEEHINHTIQESILPCYRCLSAV